MYTIQKRSLCRSHVWKLVHLYFTKLSGLHKTKKHTEVTVTLLRTLKQHNLVKTERLLSKRNLVVFYIRPLFSLLILFWRECFKTRVLHTFCMKALLPLKNKPMLRALNRKNSFPLVCFPLYSIYTAFQDATIYKSNIITWFAFCNI